LREGGSLTSVDAVTSRGVTVCIALALGAAGCSDDGGTSSPTTTTEANGTTTTTASTPPERPTSTTTTAFDPESVEGAVEAAYLRSWDVYADAVYNLDLDESALAEVYADELFTVRREEIVARVEDRRAALVEVEHDYRIEFTGVDTALIIDTYVNHQVLVDPETKEPIEEDPNATIVDAFSARRVGDDWVMFDLERLA
jgi:hypothetical protein